MKKSNFNTIQAVAQVMADSFKEDPLNQIILYEVARKDELLLAHSIIHASHAVKTGSLNLLDENPKAFLIGMDKEDESKFKDVILMLRIYLKTFSMLDVRDLKSILSNNKKIRKLLDFNWPKEFIKGRYYRVKIIAIHKDMRGTGAFRRLITPTLEFCDREGIPTVLETHNYNNVGLYTHFCFELVKTITSEEIDLKQYCMIRRPGGINAQTMGGTYE